VLALLWGALGLCIGVADLDRSADPGPVYSVAMVRAHLEQEPRAWVGQTVEVSGVAEACVAASNPPILLSCSHWPPDLMDTDDTSARGTLPLLWNAGSQWLSRLPRLPLLGSVVPAPQAIQWSMVATYRVQLLAVAASRRGGAPYYAALLQDATPGSL
jgi:hypothetical protein